MSLVSQPSLNNNNSLISSIESESRPTSDDTEATLGPLLEAFTNAHPTSMDRRAPEYSQSGLHTPYPHAFTDAHSEESPANHASATQYTSQSEARPTSYSASATPTSDYGLYQRQLHPGSNHSGSSGGMAQPTSPSLPLQDSRSNNPSQVKSDQDVPIDPSIAASAPTYAAQHAQYAPYPQQQEQMQHPGYPQHGGGLYSQPRPDWSGYAGHHPPAHGLQGYPVSGAQTPTSAAPAGQRPGQVYSFVPIPGAQQHKRPRRRYEEIERMYKCGWNGCEKAYGTLNHLNAHVTMQSHGIKRTPEEFKEIRKEWKLRKKEEDAQRKLDEERARTNAGPSDPQSADAAHAPGYHTTRNLPPIGYQPGAHQPGPHQAAPQQAAPHQPTAQVPAQYQQAPAGAVQHLQQSDYQYNGYPASPYGQTSQMYSQHNGASQGPKYEH